MQGHFNKELANIKAEFSSKMDHLQAIMEKMISFQHSNGEHHTVLPTFSAEKDQDLSSPSKANNPGNSSIPNRDPNKIRKAHVTAESASSAGERPTKTTGFLPGFSHHSPSHLKFESRPNSLIADQVQEPNFGGEPTQYGSQSRIQLTRWRPEELGTFDPNVDDIFTFVGRIREVAEIRDPRLVQLNLSLQLRGKAKRWFELELTQADKSYLYDPANGLSAWINALINRFKPSGTLMLQKLHNTSYTRADAAAKKDPIDYIHDVIALTRNRPLDESLMEAYLRFESGLRINLVPPNDQTTVHDFMDQINAKKDGWYIIYSTFRKKDEAATNQMPASIRSQRQHSAEYPTVTNGLTKYPAKPKAYHAEVQSEEEDEDWDQALTYWWRNKPILQALQAKILVVLLR